MTIKAPWNEEEIKYLKQHYLSSHAKEIGLVLGRSYSSVINQLYVQRLSSKGRKLKAVNLRIKGSRYKKLQICKLPVFHPVMLGIYPVTNQGGSHSIWRKRRHIILKMHDYCCVYCGNLANTVDHVIPISKGGIDDPMNLVAACDLCNYGMGNRTKHIQWITPRRSEQDLC